MPIPNPKPHITNLPARPRVPFVLDVPFVLSVRDVSVVRDVRGVSANARCPKKNRTPRNAKCRVGGPRVSKVLSSSSESGKPGLETFYHPVRRSGVHPLLIKEGSFRNSAFSKAGTRNSGAFQAFQPFQAFHFFHSFQLFQKRAVSAKNETPDRNSIREFVLRFFYGFIW